MDNAVDALKMAFAAFAFVLAVTVAFTAFSQARSVADLILYTNDKTNYEQYIMDNGEPKRTVGIETVISSVRRYSIENELYSVVIKDKDGNIVKRNGMELTFDLLDDEKKYLTKAQIQENLTKKLAIITKYYSDKKFEESFRSWQIKRANLLYA